jgi:hypothetical protein
VQQRRTQRGDIELHVRQDVRDFQGMRKVGIARLAQLRAMLFGRKIKGAPQRFNVARGPRLPYFFNQFKEAQLQRPRRSLRPVAHADERGKAYRLFQR